MGAQINSAPSLREQTRGYDHIRLRSCDRMSIVTPSPASDEDVPLFDGYEPPRADPEPGLSAGQRLTLRQQQDVSNGVHPLTRGPIHPLASRHRDADSPKRDPFTCGSCYFRKVIKYRGKSYAKCVFDPRRDGADTLDMYARVSHSTATDVRAWWPACRDYSPGDSLSVDAARYVPGGDA